MALSDNTSAAAARFASLPIARQVGLLLGLAASIAIGILIVIWSREPDMMPLVTQLSARDSAEVVDVLQRSGIQFQLDANQNIILVSKNDVLIARMKLAQEGLPREANASSALLDSSGAFGSSQFMENARYKQALESELARTISQFHAVKSARIHLALPKESAFVRDDRKPSASVFIDVYSGYELKKQTIASIVNLVASSIPNLSASHVTVVDQDGQLLSEGAGQTLFSTTDRYLDYRQSLEHSYSQKIQDMLIPILGVGRVKAKVSADVDFTSSEETQEKFNPNDPSLRSEQSMEERHAVASTEAMGVPGALSNKPPTDPKMAGNGQGNAQNGQNGNAQTQESDSSKDLRKQVTKNFELDKTISHTRNQPGTIKRLTVAVLVDYHQVLNPKTKKMELKPLTAEEIQQIKTLVSDAVGLNTKRGDSLNVINTSFVKPDPIESLPVEKFWEQPFFWSILKQVGGALLVLLMLFGVLRPLFKNLSSGSRSDIAKRAEAEESNASTDKSLISGLNDFDAQISLLRQLVEKEPKRVAQVVKNWVDRG